MQLEDVLLKKEELPVERINPKDGEPPYGYNTNNLSSKTDAHLLRNWAMLYYTALSELWIHK